MRKLILFYVSLLGLFLLETLLFMLRHLDVYCHYAASDWLQVLVHSLPHDLTLAGYVVALPLVLQLVHIWVPGQWYRHVMYWLLGALVTVLLILWGVDLELFSYWGFRLDATPLIYLLDNPAEALASAPWWMYVVGVVLLAMAVWGVEWFLHRIWHAPAAATLEQGQAAAVQPRTSFRSRLFSTALGLLLTGLCFLAIRGGVSESTMNVGRAYFSTEMALNQAAVNPAFSFLYSVSKRKDYGQMYRFMSNDDCLAALTEMEQLTSAPAAAPQVPTSASFAVNDSVPDSLAVASLRPHLLRDSRPNLLLIILEGFSGMACTALNPAADPRVMPQMTRLYGEGLGWTRFYANSWRTDRGVASILASYPAQPTTTVMKDQSKCNHLQYLPKRLREEGYRLQMVYGGDANFTNMLGFLRAGGIDEVVSMDDFPHADRQQQWGVPDHITYDYMYDQIVAASNESVSSPWCKVMLTLSSHEPFDVPDFHRLEHPFANSYAYADSCLGHFVDRLRAEPRLWDNLLVIILPDHCTTYPEGIEMQEPDRYHIPMVWTGGALQLPVADDGTPIHVMDALGQQTDLAATLLGQMGIHHEDFNFSKDLLDPTTPRYAFYDYPDGFGMLADVWSQAGDTVTTEVYVQDNAQDGVGLRWSQDPAGRVQRWGRAYLQHLMDDLGAR